ncbi:RDD family protein [Campylobacterota bacterium]|nr:RDD family protein [Campylobacterota bacterium]
MSEKLGQDLVREDLSVATDFRRFKAFLLDEMIVAVVVIAALWEPLTLVQDTITQIEIINANIFFIILFRIVYQTVFIAYYGATLGKMWQRIFVIDTEGFEKPTLLKSLVRASMRIVSNLCFGYGFLWAYSSPFRQTWHDKVAKTIVINA